MTKTWNEAAPVVWPEPQEMELGGDGFAIDEGVLLVVPEHASERDLFLARFLSAELADRFRVALPVKRLADIPKGARAIVMGDASNPLVQEEAARLEEAFGRGEKAERVSPDYAWDPARDLPEEGYLLLVSSDRIVISGRDGAGAFFGLQTLRQLLMPGEGGQVRARGAKVRDWPRKPFRAIRLFLPGRENIAFFKRFLRDFMALYKFNKVIVETNAAIRFDRRPELNAGWRDLAENLNRTRRCRPPGREGAFQDSVHHDTGDFGVLEKDEVADICRYARELGIDVIPEIPSLTHAYYLLTRHRELAENADVEWPDTYCPLCDGAYDLLFDMMEEVIEAMAPTTVHIGHDEWRMPMDRCPRCKGRDYRELFVQDVNRIHAWLAARGIRTAMWCDHLLETARGKGYRINLKKGNWVSAGELPEGDEEAYRMPGGLSPEMVERSIPKDILLFNWFWREAGGEGRGRVNEQAFDRWGFEHLYGNMMPCILSEDYEERSGGAGVVGGAPSLWAASTAHNTGKDQVYRFLGCAATLWSSRWPDEATLSRMIQARMPEVRRNLLGEAPPSAAGDPVTPVPLPEGESENAIRTGEMSCGDVRFEIGASSDGARVLAVDVHGDPGARTPPSAPIAVGRDVSSLIFLHACDVPGKNDMAFRRIYNFEDSADLLGFYEIEYEDGYVETAPIRFGWNVRERTWLAGRDDPDTLCFMADPVDASRDGDEPQTLWAWEWTNPRWGKEIAHVRLRATAGHKSWDEEPVAENRLVLAAVCAVEAARPVAYTDDSYDDA